MSGDKTFCCTLLLICKMARYEVVPPPPPPWLNPPKSMCRCKLLSWQPLIVAKILTHTAVIYTLIETVHCTCFGQCIIKLYRKTIPFNHHHFQYWIYRKSQDRVHKRCWLCTFPTMQLKVYRGEGVRALQCKNQRGPLSSGVDASGFLNGRLAKEFCTYSM